MASHEPRPEPEAIAFGMAVRWHREELDLTQEQVADGADLHPTYVGRIERGLHNPSVSVVFQLARGLGILAPTLIETTAGFLPEED